MTLPPKAGKGKEPVYHLYVIRAKERDQLAKALGDQGIVTAVHYPTPIHLQPPYKDGKKSFVVSETLSSEVISLPMFPAMNDEQVDRVCEAVQRFFA